MNVYDVIAIGIISLAVMFVIKTVLEFIHSMSVSAAVEKYLKESLQNGNIKIVKRDQLEALIKEEFKNKEREDNQD